MSATVAAKRMFQVIREATRKKSWLQQVRDYRGYVPIEHESSGFVVTTAMNGPQLLKALELRHEVFIEEWQGRKTFHRMDVDEYDFMADHLLIIEKPTNEVIGTYRLLSSHFTRDYYSSSQFELGEFLRLPAVKLEMGRACVSSAHRNGATIDLLWKGLTQYIQATQTRFLFGCSSVKSTDPLRISRLYKSLADDGHVDERYGSRPLADFAMDGFHPHSATPLTAAEKRAYTPPLLRTYLRAGAKIHGPPAVDLDFGCTDLLTVLDWDRLDEGFNSRFNLQKKDGPDARERVERESETR